MIEKQLDGGSNYDDSSVSAKSNVYLITKESTIIWSLIMVLSFYTACVMYSRRIADLVHN